MRGSGNGAWKGGGKGGKKKKGNACIMDVGECNHCANSDRLMHESLPINQQQIARVNCSVQDELVLSGMMQADMHRRRCVLEDIPYED